MVYSSAEWPNNAENRTIKSGIIIRILLRLEVQWSAWMVPCNKKRTLQYLLKDLKHSHKLLMLRSTMVKPYSPQ
jgi:hypothetical protein